jgi:hypothetical protein
MINALAYCGISLGNHLCKRTIRFAKLQAIPVSRPTLGFTYVRKL